MLNSSIMAPGVELALAIDHQNALVAQTQRARLVASINGHVAFGDRVRSAVGTLMLRSGAWVAGSKAAPAMTPRAAR